MNDIERVELNELCSALMAQANEIANEYLETQGE